MPVRLLGAPLLDARKTPSVRIAGREDLPALRALSQGSEDGPCWPEVAWEQFVDNPPGTARTAVLFLIREREEEPLGWIAGTALGDDAELEFLLVSPARRGLGLGRDLLTAWVAWARSCGALRAFLEVRASHERALALYRRAGFASVGVRRKYYNHPVEDATVMRLDFAVKVPPRATGHLGAST